jgi:hypothetical protein
MVELFKKMSNLVGMYLNSLDIRYTFEQKTYPDRFSVEYKCNDYTVSVNMYTICGNGIIWGRIHSETMLGPQYRLLEQLEEFKREIRSKCIFH